MDERRSGQSDEQFFSVTLHSFSIWRGVSGIGVEWGGIYMNWAFFKSTLELEHELQLPTQHELET